MSELNFNDLLAEWLDSLDEGGIFGRNDDGTFAWVDFSAWGYKADFDKFVKERIKHG